MTEEKVFEYDGKININSLEKRMFDPTDVTDENTDLLTSMKIINEQGEIMMLIETVTKDYFSDGNTRCEKGCLIKRFEFCKMLVNTHIWHDFFKRFVTAIQYAMIQKNDEYLPRYSYVWTKVYKDEPCIIAGILGLDKKYCDGDYTINISNID